MTWHNCHGQQVHSNMASRTPIGDAVYYSPEEYALLKRLSGDGPVRMVEKFTCDWPDCDCPLSTVPGVAHVEKIDRIIERRKADPKFKVRIKI